MKNFTIGSLLAVSTFLATAGITPTYAADNDNQAATQPWAFNSDRMLQRGPLSKLDLNETQKTQISAILSEQAQKRPDSSNRQQRVDRIKALFESETLNSEELNAIADEVAENAKQRFINRIETFHQIAQVLTPEQREKIKSMHHSGKGWHGRGHGWGGMGMDN